MPSKKIKFYNIENILSEKNKLKFEETWEKYILEPSKYEGGLYPYLCLLYGAPKKTEVEDRQFVYWSQPLILEKKKSLLFSIVYKYKGSVVEDCFFACNKKVSENNAMLGWQLFTI